MNRWIARNILRVLDPNIVCLGVKGEVWKDLIRALESKVNGCGSTVSIPCLRVTVIARGVACCRSALVGVTSPFGSHLIKQCSLVSRSMNHRKDVCLNVPRADLLGTKVYIKHDRIGTVTIAKELLIVVHTPSIQKSFGNRNDEVDARFSTDLLLSIFTSQVEVGVGIDPFDTSIEKNVFDRIISLNTNKGTPRTGVRRRGYSWSTFSSGDRKLIDDYLRVDIHVFNRGVVDFKGEETVGVGFDVVVMEDRCWTENPEVDGVIFTLIDDCVYDRVKLPEKITELPLYNHRKFPG